MSIPLFQHLQLFPPPTPPHPIIFNFGPLVSTSSSTCLPCYSIRTGLPTYSLTVTGSLQYLISPAQPSWLGMFIYILAPSYPRSPLPRTLVPINFYILTPKVQIISAPNQPFLLAWTHTFEPKHHSSLHPSLLPYIGLQTKPWDILHADQVYCYFSQSLMSTNICDHMKPVSHMHIRTGTSFPLFPLLCSQPFMHKPSSLQA